LADFTLLKHSHHDIINKPWTIPLNREVASKYFKILCAQEKITRLNVEACRLHAWVDYEDKQLLSVAMKLKQSDPLLAMEVQALYVTRHHVNNLHRKCLCLIYELDGYSSPGSYSLASDTTDDNDEDISSNPNVLVDKDDDVCDEMLRLGDCLASIS
jgi:hypothetical protein